MKNMNLVISASALAFAALFTVPASAYSATDTVICKDGSNSHGGKGSCAHHGGIDKKATKAVGTSAPASAPAPAPAPAKAEAAPAAGAPEAEAVTCKDGSSSHSGKGACSHHGGIKKSGSSESPAAAPAAPASAAPAAPAATSTESTNKAGSSEASGATAKCKDGTFSHSKHHTGSCSHHGGVDKFLE